MSNSAQAPKERHVQSRKSSGGIDISSLARQSLGHFFLVGIGEVCVLKSSLPRQMAILGPARVRESRLALESGSGHARNVLYQSS